MASVLESLLSGVIRTGRLTIHTGARRTMTFGQKAPGGGEPDVAVHLLGSLTTLKLGFHPDLYLGEAYMSGALVLERGDLWDLMELIGLNFANQQTPNLFRRLLDAARWRLAGVTGPSKARRNAAHHYDHSLGHYRRFLDPDLQYSCAYFPDPKMSLEDAQAAKKRHIIAKLLLEPGQKVLDIGCGWGGLALELARDWGVEVLGVTLSEEQLQVCRERARNAGLQRRVRFELRDYREVEGQFDRVVSVGMLEHVGARRYDAFFEAVGRLLSNDGVALIHSIGQRRAPGGPSNPWISKHIFPGGYIPALSEIVSSVERVGLWVTDVEILRLHYAQTLRLWREAFMARASLVETLYDARFVRMWEFYLASCEMSFRYGDLMVAQTQLAKRVDAVPVTRDYMAKAELEGGASVSEPARAERR